MKLIYSEHAALRLVKRGLRKEWVERVIDSPSRIEDDMADTSLEHRLGLVPELANHVLRVIVSKAEPKRVITAYLDRKLKGKL
jgi:hypothetical protein